jgi:hypothetical protein
MLVNGRRGVLSRVLAAVRWAVLGKSDPDYVRRLAGGDQYWDEAIAAQLGWPGSRYTSPAGTHPGGRPAPSE